MIALGLDPSLRGFGWCIYDSSASGPSRVVAKGRWKTSPKEIWVARYVRLREQIGCLLDRHPEITAVGVESPPFGEQFSEGLYALFVFVNEAVWSRRRDVVHFDPGSVKMLAKQDPKLRKGKMFKSDMIEAAKEDTGVARWNADEADAYHIARAAARFWSLLRGEIALKDLTPSEFQAFAREHTFTRGKRAGQTVSTGAVFKENQRFFRFSSLATREQNAAKERENSTER
jgi:Holliday junction resolvasome RuvABC endonuclease subunit